MLASLITSDIEDLRWFAPVVLGRYPHMSAQDTSVWSAFLSLESVDFLRCSYDVHVGTLPPLPDDASDAMVATAAGVAVKRIDVVAELRDSLWIIEIKPYGNAFALGQALLYRSLFRSRFGSPKRLLPVILCNELDRDVADYAPKKGIICIALNIPELF